MPSPQAEDEMAYQRQSNNIAYTSGRWLNVQGLLRASSLTGNNDDIALLPYSPGAEPLPGIASPRSWNAFGFAVTRTTAAPAKGVAPVREAEPTTVETSGAPAFVASASAALRRTLAVTPLRHDEHASIVVSLGLDGILYWRPRLPATPTLSDPLALVRFLLLMRRSSPAEHGVELTPEDAATPASLVELALSRVAEAINAGAWSPEGPANVRHLFTELGLSTLLAPRLLPKIESHAKGPWGIVRGMIIADAIAAVVDRASRLAVWSGVQRIREALPGFRRDVGHESLRALAEGRNASAVLGRVPVWAPPMGTDIPFVGAKTTSDKMTTERLERIYEQPLRTSDWPDASPSSPDFFAPIASAMGADAKGAEDDTTSPAAAGAGAGEGSSPAPPLVAADSPSKGPSPIIGAAAIPEAALRWLRRRSDTVRAMVLNGFFGRPMPGADSDDSTHTDLPEDRTVDGIPVCIAPWLNGSVSVSRDDEREALLDRLCGSMHDMEPPVISPEYPEDNTILLSMVKDLVSNEDLWARALPTAIRETFAMACAAGGAGRGSPAVDAVSGKILSSDVEASAHAPAVPLQRALAPVAVLDDTLSLMGLRLAGRLEYRFANNNLRTMGGAFVRPHMGTWAYPHLTGTLAAEGRPDPWVQHRIAAQAMADLYEDQFDVTHVVAPAGIRLPRGVYDLEVTTRRALAGELGPRRKAQTLTAAEAGVAIVPDVSVHGRGGSFGGSSAMRKETIEAAIVAERKDVALGARARPGSSMAPTADEAPVSEWWDDGAKRPEHLPIRDSAIPITPSHPLAVPSSVAGESAVSTPRVPIDSPLLVGGVSLAGERDGTWKAANDCDLSEVFAMRAANAPSPFVRSPSDAQVCALQHVVASCLIELVPHVMRGPDAGTPIARVLPNTYGPAVFPAAFGSTLPVPPSTVGGMTELFDIKNRLADGLHPTETRTLVTSPRVFDDGSLARTILDMLIDMPAYTPVNPTTLAASMWTVIADLAAHCTDDSTALWATRLARKFLRAPRQGLDVSTAALTLRMARMLHTYGEQIDRGAVLQLAKAMGPLPAATGSTSSTHSSSSPSTAIPELSSLADARKPESIAAVVRALNQGRFQDVQLALLAAADATAAAHSGRSTAGGAVAAASRATVSLREAMHASLSGVRDALVASWEKHPVVALMRNDALISRFLPMPLVPTAPGAQGVRDEVQPPAEDLAMGGDIRAIVDVSQDLPSSGDIGTLARILEATLAAKSGLAESSVRTRHFLAALKARCPMVSNEVLLDLHARDLIESPRSANADGHALMQEERCDNRFGGTAGASTLADRPAAGLLTGTSALAHAAVARDLMLGGRSNLGNPVYAAAMLEIALHVPSQESPATAALHINALLAALDASEAAYGQHSVAACVARLELADMLARGGSERHAVLVPSSLDLGFSPSAAARRLLQKTEVVLAQARAMKPWLQAADTGYGPEAVERGQPTGCRDPAAVDPSLREWQLVALEARCLIVRSILAEAPGEALRLAEAALVHLHSIVVSAIQEEQASPTPGSDPSPVIVPESVGDAAAADAAAVDDAFAWDYSISDKLPSLRELRRVRTTGATRRYGDIGVGAIFTARLGGLAHSELARALRFAAARASAIAARGGPDEPRARIVADAYRRAALAAATQAVQCSLQGLTPSSMLRSCPTIPPRLQDPIALQLSLIMEIDAADRPIPDDIPLPRTVAAGDAQTDRAVMATSVFHAGIARIVRLTESVGLPGGASAGADAPTPASGSIVATALQAVARTAPSWERVELAVARLLARASSHDRLHDSPVSKQTARTLLELLLLVIGRALRHGMGGLAPERIAAAASEEVESLARVDEGGWYAQCNPPGSRAEPPHVMPAASQGEEDNEAAAEAAAAAAAQPYGVWMGTYMTADALGRNSATSHVALMTHLLIAVEVLRPLVQQADLAEDMCPRLLHDLWNDFASASLSAVPLQAPTGVELPVEPAPLSPASAQSLVDLLAPVSSGKATFAESAAAIDSAVRGSLQDEDLVSRAFGILYSIGARQAAYMHAVDALQLLSSTSFASHRLPGGSLILDAAMSIAPAALQCHIGGVAWAGRDEELAAAFEAEDDPYLSEEGTAPAESALPEKRQLRSPLDAVHIVSSFPPILSLDGSLSPDRLVRLVRHLACIRAEPPAGSDRNLFRDMPYLSSSPFVSASLAVRLLAAALGSRLDVDLSGDMQMTFAVEPTAVSDFGRSGRIDPNVISFGTRDAAEFFSKDRSIAVLRASARVSMPAMRDEVESDLIAARIAAESTTDRVVRFTGGFDVARGVFSFMVLVRRGNLPADNDRRTAVAHVLMRVENAHGNMCAGGTIGYIRDQGIILRLELDASQHAPDELSMRVIRAAHATLAIRKALDAAYAGDSLESVMSRLLAGPFVAHAMIAGLSPAWPVPVKRFVHPGVVRQGWALPIFRRLGASDTVGRDIAVEGLERFAIANGLNPAEAKFRVLPNGVAVFALGLNSPLPGEASLEIAHYAHRCQVSVNATVAMVPRDPRALACLIGIMASANMEGPMLPMQRRYSLSVASGPGGDAVYSIEASVTAEITASMSSILQRAVKDALDMRNECMPAVYTLLMTLSTGQPIPPLYLEVAPGTSDPEPAPSRDECAWIISASERDDASRIAGTFDAGRNADGMPPIDVQLDELTDLTLPRWLELAASAERVAASVGDLLTRTAEDLRSAAASLDAPGPAVAWWSLTDARNSSLEPLTVDPAAATRPRPRRFAPKSLPGGPGSGPQLQLRLFGRAVRRLLDNLPGWARLRGASPRLIEAMWIFGEVSRQPVFCAASLFAMSSTLLWPQLPQSSDVHEWFAKADAGAPDASAAASKELGHESLALRLRGTGWAQTAAEAERRRKVAEVAERCLGVPFEEWLVRSVGEVIGHEVHPCRATSAEIRRIVCSANLDTARGVRPMWGSLSLPIMVRALSASVSGFDREFEGVGTLRAGQLGMVHLAMASHTSPSFTWAMERSRALIMESAERVAVSPFPAGLSSLGSPASPPGGDAVLPLMTEVIDAPLAAHSMLEVAGTPQLFMSQVLGSLLGVRANFELASRELALVGGSMFDACVDGFFSGTQLLFKDSTLDLATVVRDLGEQGMETALAPEERFPPLSTDTIGLPEMVDTVEAEATSEQIAKAREALGSLNLGGFVPSDEKAAHGVMFWASQLGSAIGTFSESPYSIRRLRQNVVVPLMALLSAGAHFSSIAAPVLVAVMETPWAAAVLCRSLAAYERYGLLPAAEAWVADAPAGRKRSLPMCRGFVSVQLFFEACTSIPMPGAWHSSPPSGPCPVVGVAPSPFGERGNAPPPADLGTLFLLRGAECGDPASRAVMFALAACLGYVAAGEGAVMPAMETRRIGSIRGWYVDPTISTAVISAIGRVRVTSSCIGVACQLPGDAAKREQLAAVSVHAVEAPTLSAAAIHAFARPLCPEVDTISPANTSRACLRALCAGIGQVGSSEVSLEAWLSILGSNDPAVGELLHRRFASDWAAVERSVLAPTALIEPSPSTIRLDAIVPTDLRYLDREVWLTLPRVAEAQLTRLQSTLSNLLISSMFEDSAACSECETATARILSLCDPSAEAATNSFLQAVADAVSIKSFRSLTLLASDHAHLDRIAALAAAPCPPVVASALAQRFGPSDRTLYEPLVRELAKISTTPKDAALARSKAAIQASIVEVALRCMRFVVEVPQGIWEPDVCTRSCILVYGFLLRDDVVDMHAPSQRWTTARSALLGGALSAAAELLSRSAFTMYCLPAIIFIGALASRIPSILADAATSDKDRGVILGELGVTRLVGTAALARFCRPEHPTVGAEGRNGAMFASARLHSAFALAALYPEGVEPPLLTPLPPLTALEAGAWDPRTPRDDTDAGSLDFAMDGPVGRAETHEALERAIVSAEVADAEAVAAFSAAVWRAMVRTPTTRGWMRSQLLALRYSLTDGLAPESNGIVAIVRGCIFYPVTIRFLGAASPAADGSLAAGSDDETGNAARILRAVARFHAEQLFAHPHELLEEVARMAGLTTLQIMQNDLAPKAARDAVQEVLGLV